MSNERKLLASVKAQYGALKQERENILPVWKQLTDNFAPLSRPLLDVNKGPTDIYGQLGDLNDDIFDSTPVMAIKTAASGMQSGLSSPSAKWFRLGHSDLELEQQPQVKEWLEAVQTTLYSVMSRSNFYNATHELYLELPLIGTSAMFIESDLTTVIKCSVLSAGEYSLAENGKGERDTLFRDVSLTARQIVERFGEENSSVAVRQAFKSDSADTSRFNIVHGIFPNKDRQVGKIDNLNKPFLSVYWEESVDTNFLSLGGFDENPFVAPRWGIQGNGVYGVSPAMDLIPFARQLQEMTLAMVKAAQLELEPPLNAPPSQKRVDLTPGAVNRFQGAEKVESILNVKSDPRLTLGTIQELKSEIREGLFNDLFKTLALAPTQTMTATEVAERVAEGLRLLGPVLERNQTEFLSPTIDRIFAVCHRNGLFPEPPEELQGQPLKVEYISPLAQAQKAEGAVSITRLLGFAQAVGSLNPASLDVMNFDESLRIYAEFLGVSLKVINSPEDIDRIREMRAKFQADQIARQQESDTIGKLKTLSDTEVTPGTNALEAATQGTR
jgi:hypothetical protein